MLVYFKKSVKRKLVLVIVPFIVVIGAFIWLYYPAMQERQIRDSLGKYIGAMAEMIAFTSGNAIGEGNIEGIVNTLEWAKQDPNVIYIGVIDPSANVMAEYNPQHQIFNYHDLVKLSVVKEEHELLFSTREIIHNNQHYGTIILGYWLHETKSRIAQHRNFSLIILSLLFAIGTIVILFIGKIIVNPIEDLNRAALRVGQGDMGFSVPVTTSDEVATLATSFNKMVNDIKTSLEALRASETQYRNLVETMHEFVAEMSLEGIFTFVNKPFAEMTGYTTKELVGTNFFSYVHPDDLSSTSTHCAQLVNEGKPVRNCEYRFRRKDGNYLDLVTSGDPICDIDGKMKTILQVSFDITERKQAEEKLRYTEGLYRGAITAGEAVPYRHDYATNSYPFMGQGILQLTGYKPEEMTPARWRQIIEESIIFGDAGNLDWEEAVHKTRAGEFQRWRSDNLIRTRDGQQRWIADASVEIRDEQGRSTGSVGILIDITERKREEALRAGQSRVLEMIARNAPLEDVLTTLMHFIESQSKGMLCSVLLLEEDGQHVRHGGVSSLPEAYTKAIDGATIGPQAGSCGTAMYRREPVIVTDISQDPLWTDYRILAATYGLRACWSTPIILHQGKVLGSFAMYYREVRSPSPAEKQLIDIATRIAAIAIERKRAEEAIRRSEENYRNLFEESKDVIFTSTIEGRFIDINPAGVQLFGYSSKEELLRIDIAKDLYSDPKERETFRRVLERNAFVKDYELTIKRRDGQKVIVLSTANAVHNDKGNVVAYRGIMRDITERKQLEKQLIQAQKMESLGTLAGGIAHDFNNLLGIILGYASMLERSHGQGDIFTRGIGAINKAVERGAGLVQQLLMFARKSDATFGSVKVNDTVNEVIKMLGETFPKTISIMPQLEQDLPPIIADHNQLHQVLINLCVNARDSMQKGGELSITTCLATGKTVRMKFPQANGSEYVVIHVSDTGTGMDEATRNRIFEPFFTTKDIGKGTGLGLALVYGILENHRGFIDVASEIGHGTTFSVYFPARQHLLDDLHQKKGPIAEPLGGTETILLVEDEHELMELASAFLSAKGYHVLTANDGEEAVNLFSHHHTQVALVITDMGLPKLSGDDVFLKLKEISPNVKVIVASGFWDPKTKSEMFKAGAKEFVQKPYNLNELSRKIREVIEIKN